MTGRVLVIANPAAGRSGGRAGRLGRWAERALVARGTEAALELTAGPGHAAELAARAVVAGWAKILVCGGDGTVGEVAGALAHTDVALGIVPCGLGNDLARELGIPADPRRALAAFASGAIRTMDLGRANGRPFCTVAGVGFDAAVAERVRGGWLARVGGGALGYRLGALSLLAGFSAPRLRITGDFGCREGRYLLAAVANGGSYGSGIRVAPAARLDDGLLDGCLVRDASRWKRLRIFAAALRGRHLAFPEVEMVQSRAFRIEADRPLPVVVDGELGGATPVTLSVESGALRVVVPRSRAR